MRPVTWLLVVLTISLPFRLASAQNSPLTRRRSLLTGAIEPFVLGIPSMPDDIDSWRSGTIAVTNAFAGSAIRA